MRLCVPAAFGFSRPITARSVSRCSASALRANPRSAETADALDFHISIVTDSVSQFEDDRRGAERFQSMYGKDAMKPAIYPDNFTEELETAKRRISKSKTEPKSNIKFGFPLLFRAF